MGKILIISGVILIIVGLILTFIPKNLSIGKLPGDIVIERENFKFYLPLTTSILISILITILFMIIGKLR